MATFARHTGAHRIDKADEGVELIYHAASGWRQGSLDVASRGEVLLIEAVTCGNCAAIIGWSFIGKVADVDPLALRNIACEATRRPGLGLNLQNVGDWKRLLAQPPLQSASPECGDPAGVQLGRTDPATLPPLLGAPCSTASQDITAAICQGGVIAGFYARTGSVGRGDAFDLVYMGPPKVHGHGIHEDAHLEVAIRGDVLFVHQIDCQRCVAVLGWTFAGSLAKLADKALRELACRVTGLSGSGLNLRSAEGWELLLAKSRLAGVASPECAP